MAAAIVKGLVNGSYPPSSIGCVSGSGTTAKALSDETGITVFDSVDSLAQEASVWVLALKPYQLSDLPDSLAELSKGKLILSVLAGIPLEKLQKHFPKARNWVRTMPNTPSQIGKGVTGVSYALSPSAEDQSMIGCMLSAVGSVITIDEMHMDALTSVSGSGVAYIFEWASAMMESAIAQGLPPEIASALTLETFTGASALMAAQPNTHPDTLRDAVVSKGGTTEAALNVFSKNNTRGIIDEAMRAAAQRSKELSA